MLCFLGIHDFIPDAGNQDQDERNCVTFLRCTRCNKIRKQDHQTTHSYDYAKGKTSFQCNGDELPHVCERVQTNTCIKCGYKTSNTYIEAKFVSDDQAPSISSYDGCKITRNCPGCGKTFRDFIFHSFVRTNNFQPVDDFHCEQQIKCSVCGYSEFTSDTGIMNSFGFSQSYFHEWDQVEYIHKNGCKKVRASTCKRCGYQYTDEQEDHLWKVLRTFNHRYYEVAGGDENAWEEEHICQECGKQEIVTRTQNPIF